MDKGAKFVIENFNKILELVKLPKYKKYYNTVMSEYKLIKSLKKTGDAYDHFLKFADQKHKNAEKFKFLEEYGLLSNEKISDYLKNNYFDELNNRVNIDDLVLDGMYTYSDLYILFNNTMSGIKYNKEKNIIGLVFGHSKVYDDYWVGDTMFFSGEGRTGDQKYNNQGNKALLSSNKNKSRLYLFEKIESDRYCYRGEVYLADTIRVEKEFDEKHNYRNVIKYPLKFVDKSRKLTYDIKDEELITKTKDEVVNNMPDDILHEIAKTIKPTKEKKYVQTPVVERNKFISRDTKNRAKGICDLCGNNAPFSTNNGPYLESHHVITIAEGGPDVIYNTVALCPNCHRRMHSLKDQKDYKKLVEVLYKYLLDDNDKENLSNWEKLFK